MGCSRRARPRGIPWQTQTEQPLNYQHNNNTATTPERYYPVAWGIPMIGVVGGPHPKTTPGGILWPSASSSVKPGIGGCCPNEDPVPETPLFAHIRFATHRRGGAGIPIVSLRVAAAVCAQEATLGFQRWRTRASPLARPARYHIRACIHAGVLSALRVGRARTTCQGNAEP